MASLADTFCFVFSARVTAKIAFLAFSTLSCIIFFIFPFLLMMMPKYLYVLTKSSLVPPIVNGSSSFVVPLAMIIHCVFFELRL